MVQTIEFPVDLVPFELPAAVQDRLQYLLDRQEMGEPLTSAELDEAAGLVEVAEFLSLLHLRSIRISQQAK